MLEHQEASGEGAGIFPPIHFALLALTLEGYTPYDSPICRGLKAIEQFS